LCLLLLFTSIQLRLNVGALACLFGHWLDLRALACLIGEFICKGIDEGLLNGGSFVTTEAASLNGHVGRVIVLQCTVIK
jgi:hypothetical protein